MDEKEEKEKESTAVHLGVPQGFWDKVLVTDETKVQPYDRSEQSIF